MTIVEPACAGSRLWGCKELRNCYWTLIGPRFSQQRLYVTALKGIGPFCNVLRRDDTGGSQKQFPANVRNN
jgi:hypothetical protein